MLNMAKTNVKMDPPGVKRTLDVGGPSELKEKSTSIHKNK